MRCWAADLDVSVLDQQLKLFVSRHSAFLSEHVPGEKTPPTFVLKRSRVDGGWVSGQEVIMSSCVPQDSGLCITMETFWTPKLC